MDRIIYYCETNVACLLILSIVLISYLNFSSKSLRGKLFILMISCVMGFCVSDILAVVFRGTTFPISKLMVWSSNIMYIVCMLLVGYLWFFFASIVLKGKLNKFLTYSISLIVGIFLILTISTPLHGLVFTVDENNLYVRGPLVWVNYIEALLCYFSVFLLFGKSKASRVEKLAVIGFPIFPIIATILQFLFYGFTLGQVGLTASIVLVYSLLQGIDFNEQRLKTQIYNEISKIDVLTKLQNRRCYDERIIELEKASWVGVIFMDLNGLKEVNDREGHAAGDEFIKSFSELIKTVFNYDDIYRISGDEFVVLTTNKNNFMPSLNRLYKVNIDNNEICAYGHAECMNNDLTSSIRNAELMMYEYKKNYYIKTGKNRRVS